MPRERTILRQIASHQFIRIVYRAWVQTARGYSTVYPREVTDSTWVLLRGFKLYAKASKCEMLKTSMEFLGQQISRGGMAPTEAKLKAVHDWATPENVKGVRCFLGFANYYRRFV